MRILRRRLGYESLESRDLLATIHFPHQVIGDPGHEIVVPIGVDEAAGVRAAEIHVQYDTAAFDVTPEAVAAGTAWLGKASVIANVDDAAGEMVVYVFMADGSTSGPGSLLDISFKIRDDICKVAAEINLVHVRLNEGQIGSPPPPATSGSLDSPSSSRDSSTENPAAEGKTAVLSLGRPDALASEPPGAEPPKAEPLPAAQPVASPASGREPADPPTVPDAQVQRPIELDPLLVDEAFSPARVMTRLLLSSEL